MTTARWGWNMVRAQVTAWSERRSRGGAVLVVIMGRFPPARWCWVVGLSTADHTDTEAYVPVFWRLVGQSTNRHFDSETMY